MTFKTKHAVATLLTKLSQAKASKRFDDLAERILEEPYYRDRVSCSTNAELADVLANWMAARLKKQRCAGSDDEWRA